MWAISLVMIGLALDPAVVLNYELFLFLPVFTYTVISSLSGSNGYNVSAVWTLDVARLSQRIVSFTTSASVNSIVDWPRAWRLLSVGWRARVCVLKARFPRASWRTKSCQRTTTRASYVAKRHAVIASCHVQSALITSGRLTTARYQLAASGQLSFRSVSVGHATLAATSIVTVAMDWRSTN